MEPIAKQIDLNLIHESKVILTKAEYKALRMNWFSQKIDTIFGID
jgi:hypothetical protein